MDDRLQALRRSFDPTDRESSMRFFNELKRAGIEPTGLEPPAFEMELSGGDNWIWWNDEFGHRIYFVEGHRAWTQKEAILKAVHDKMVKLHRVIAAWHSGPWHLVPIADLVMTLTLRANHDEYVNLLAASMRKHGLHQPVVVTPKMRVVDGMARVLAAKVLGWTSVPTQLVRILSDEELARVSILANMHRGQ